MVLHSLPHSISLSITIMEPWALEPQMFAYDCFVKNDETGGQFNTIEESGHMRSPIGP